MKYLIEYLWFDPMENRDAHGYAIYGYLDTEEEAIEFCKQGKIYNKEECWSFRSNMPQFRYKKINLLTLSAK